MSTAPSITSSSHDTFKVTTVSKANRVRVSCSGNEALDPSDTAGNLEPAPLALPSAAAADTPTEPEAVPVAAPDMLAAPEVPDAPVVHPASTTHAPVRSTAAHPCKNPRRVITRSFSIYATSKADSGLLPLAKYTNDSISVYPSWKKRKKTSAVHEPPQRWEWIYVYWVNGSHHRSA